MHWRRPELAIVTVIIDGDNRRTEEDHGEKVPPHRKDIGWSRKKRCVWESRFFLYVLAMYVYKSSVVCKCVCGHDFIQLSKLHDANAARIRRWRKPWLSPPTKSYTRDFLCPCQPVEALKPNAAECPPFYDMPTESNLCASGSWLDASPEHHFETNPWRGIVTLFTILSYSLQLHVWVVGRLERHSGYLELHRF